MSDTEKHPFCQESGGGWRKDESRPLVRVNALFPSVHWHCLLGDWQVSSLQKPQTLILKVLFQSGNGITQIYRKNGRWNGDGREDEVVTEEWPRCNRMLSVAVHWSRSLRASMFVLSTVLAPGANVDVAIPWLPHPLSDPTLLSK